MVTKIINWFVSVFKFFFDNSSNSNVVNDDNWEKDLKEDGWCERVDWP